MKTRGFIYAFIALMCLAACSELDHEKVRNNEFKEIVMTKADAAMTAQINSLAFELMGEMAGEPGSNIVFSPFSITSSLSILANGAVNKTQDDIIEALGYDGFAIDEVNDYYLKMVQSLAASDKTVDFSPMNAIWVDNSFPLKESFVDVLSGSFMAEAMETDFAGGNALESINSWYEKHSNGKIQKMFNSVSTDIELLISNALTFEADWKTKDFEVKDDSFYHEDGTVSVIPMICDDARAAAYNQTDDFQCLELAYGNGAFVLDLLLPREGLSVSDASCILTDEYWESNLSHLYENINVELQFPKFKISSKTDMKDVLANIGLSEVFSASADFSEISETDPSPHMFMHACSIDVTENGTQASASSGMDFQYPIADLDPSATYTFKADRPFFFLIREKSTGVILFAGVKG